MINSFRNEFAFLSNFHPCPVKYEGMIFGSVEAAFQAAKLEDKAARAVFQHLSPSQAKARGRRVPLRAGWNGMRVDVMRELLLSKFSAPALRDRLLATYAHELIEGNTWNDTFWGVCNGQGRNILGKLLMEVRETV